jgi:hypothetical protein
MGLVLYLRHLEEPLRNDVARLFEVSGLWVRNVGDRHYTKQQIQRISRRILQRLDVRSDSWKFKGGFRRLRYPQPERSLNVLPVASSLGDRLLPGTLSNPLGRPKAQHPPPSLIADLCFMVKGAM